VVALLAAVCFKAYRVVTSLRENMDALTATTVHSLMSLRSGLSSIRDTMVAIEDGMDRTSRPPPCPGSEETERSDSEDDDDGERRGEGGAAAQDSVSPHEETDRVSRSSKWLSDKTKAAKDKLARFATSTPKTKPPLADDIEMTPIERP